MAEHWISFMTLFASWKCFSIKYPTLISLFNDHVPQFCYFRLYNIDDTRLFNLHIRFVVDFSKLIFKNKT